MSRQNKIAIMPKLHDYDGDTTKQWFVFYSYRNPADGKMKRFRIYEGFAEFQTKEQKIDHALLLMDKIRQKLQNGWSPFDDDEKVIYEDSLMYQSSARKYGRKREGNKRFDYYCSQFLTTHTGIRPSTYTTYKSKFRYFNEFLEIQKIHENDITEFNRDHVRDFQVYLKKTRKLSNKTINEYNVLLKGFFKYLIGYKLLKNNPFEDCKKLKCESKKPRIYTHDLLQRISNEASLDDPQMLLAIRIIFNCFIRPGELRFLTLNEVDFHRGKITIPAHIAKDKTERKVDIPVYILDDLINQGFRKYPSHYYIISKEGKPAHKHVSRNFLYRRFVAIKKTLNLPKEYQLYAFKHTGMVELKLSGADWLEIRDQAGHASIDQTAEYTTELMAQGSQHIRTRGPRI